MKVTINTIPNTHTRSGWYQHKKTKGIYFYDASAGLTHEMIGSLGRIKTFSNLHDNVGLLVSEWDRVKSITFD